MDQQVGHLVGEISEDEHNAGRPMLSALVVEKDTGMPSSGFYDLARELGLLTGTTKSDKKGSSASNKRSYSIIGNRPSAGPFLGKEFVDLLHNPLGKDDGVVDR